MPEANYLLEFCKKMNIAGSLNEICKNKKVRNVILTELNRLGKQAGLMYYEQIRNIYLHPEMFTIDNELATPTMKIKRLAVREYFKNEIVNLYAEIAAGKSKL